MPDDCASARGAVRADAQSSDTAKGQRAWDGERMTKEGKLDLQAVNVFYKTPPFFDYVWVARKNLDPSLAEKVAAAFLKLNASDAEQKKILDLLSASKYVKANDGDYDKLRQAAIAAGLLK